MSMILAHTPVAETIRIWCYFSMDRQWKMMKTRVKSIRFTFVFIMIYVTGGVDQCIGKITTPPVDTVGCCGSVSSFYCDSIKSDVLVVEWTIEGHTVTESIKEKRGITINDTRLHITAKPTNNDIAVGCNIVTSSPPYIDSVGAIFTVSTIPPVVDLNITIDNNTLTGTWSEPDCLPTNYIYLYTVNISNQTIITGNTTETMFITTIPQLCTNYTVSVRVSAPDYMECSDSTEVTETVFPSLDAAPIQLLLPKIVFQTAKICSLIVPYKILNTSKSQECTVDISVNITGINKPIHIYREIMLDSQSEYFNVSNISERFVGNMVIDVPGTNSRYIRTINTYNVKSYVIEIQSSGLVNVTCVFATGSSASGCLVNFIYTDNTQYNITVTRTNNCQICSAVCGIGYPGIYNATIYEIVNNICTVVDYFYMYTYIELNDSMTTSPTRASGNSSTIGFITLLPSTTSATIKNYTYFIPLIVTTSMIMILILVVILTAAILYRHKSQLHDIDELDAPVKITKNQAYEKTELNYHMKTNPSYEIVNIKMKKNT